MMHQAPDDGPVEANAHVGPAHPRAPGAVQLVLLPVGDVGEVGYAGIVVVLAREDGGVEVPWVNVGDGVAWVVSMFVQGVRVSGEGGERRC